MDLRGKVAIVTGAGGGGSGEAIAKRLARESTSTKGARPPRGARAREYARGMAMLCQEGGRRRIPRLPWAYDALTWLWAHPRMPPDFSPPSEDRPDNLALPGDRKARRRRDGRGVPGHGLAMRLGCLVRLGRCRGDSCPRRKAGPQRCALAGSPRWFAARAHASVVAVLVQLRFVGATCEI